MFKKLKSIYNNLIRKNNEGLSIVTVLVAIGFVLIIVSILMVSSTVNFKMKNVNVRSKESFYSAETVLDEINAGLAQLVSDGLSSSYRAVLTSYADEELTSAEKNELIKGNYYEYVVDKLGFQVGTTSEYRYVCMPTYSTAPYSSTNPVHNQTGAIDEGLYSFVKNSTRWHDGTVDTSYGAFIRAKDVSKATYKGQECYVGKMVVTDNEGIFLKDVLIYYRDTNGIVSEIKTDIRIAYPDFVFSNPNMPQVSTYSLITDSGLIREKKGIDKSAGDTAANSVTIMGDSYAYLVDMIGSNIKYIQDAAITEKKMDTHIVATDINVVNGGMDADFTSKIWARDIVAKSSNVVLNGYSYIQDDLNLKGKDSSLTIGGYYYGYGNSLTSSQESSAILVNGMGTTIDFRTVQKLSLAGRAFVGTEKRVSMSSVTGLRTGSGLTSASEKVGVLPDPGNPTLDFPMGSSIAAKSDQLMYLIPAECIGVNSEGKSKYSKNPLTGTKGGVLGEYEDIKNNPSDYDLVARNKMIPKLGIENNTLDYYLKPGSAGVTEVTLTAKDGTPLHFFYMSFADDMKANEFFMKYYGNNKDSVDKYAKQYIKFLSFPDDADIYLKVDMAGSSLDDIDVSKDTTSYSTGNLVSNNAIRLKGDDYATISDSFDEEYLAYSRQFLAYKTALTSTMDNADKLIQRGSPDNNKAVFNNIVDNLNQDGTQGGAFAAIFEGVSGHKIYFKDQDGVNRVLFIHYATKEAQTATTPEKYELYELTAEDMKCNLIVADCNVKVPAGVSKFEGTMIIKGTIQLPSENSFEFKSNQKKVNECMYLTTDDGVYSVFDVFFDASKMNKYVPANYDGSDITTASLVEFSNWSRNAEIEDGVVH